MRIAPKYLIGAAALTALGAGVAQAASAKLHSMQVDAPDGSVVEVQYTGDVAPRVHVVPVEAVTLPAAVPVAADPFARMARISAIMDAHMQAMMQRAAVLRQRAAQMQQQAVAHGNARAAPSLTLVGDMPQGMHVTYYSSTTDANGCTRTVSYSSDGSGEAPKLTEAASDGCNAAQPQTGVVPAKAEQPAAKPEHRAPAPGITV